MHRGIGILMLVLAVVSAGACGDAGDLASGDANGDRAVAFPPLVPGTLAELTGPW
jgi:hypothetical protein